VGWVVPSKKRTYKQGWKSKTSSRAKNRYKLAHSRFGNAAENRVG